MKSTLSQHFSKASKAWCFVIVNNYYVNVLMSELKSSSVSEKTVSDEKELIVTFKYNIGCWAKKCLIEKNGSSTLRWKHCCNWNICSIYCYFIFLIYSFQNWETVDSVHVFCFGCMCRFFCGHRVQRWYVRHECPAGCYDSKHNTMTTHYTHCENNYHQNSAVS